MAYIKIVKKGEKKYGPYLYESYRDSEGVVKKRYLGKVKNKKRNNKPLILGITLLLILGVFVGFYFLNNDFNNFIKGGARFVGFVVSSNESTVDSEQFTDNESTVDSEQLTDNESTVDSEQLTDNESTVDSEQFTDEQSTVDGGQLTDNESTVDGQQFTDNESTVDSEQFTDNESTVDSEQFTDNQSTVDGSQLTDNLTSDDENETSEAGNETLDIGSQMPDSGNETLDDENLTSEVGNETSGDEDLSTVNGLPSTVNREPSTVYRERIVIGRPVKWVVVINSSDENISVEVNLPLNVENISVVKGDVEVKKLINEINESSVVPESDAVLRTAFTGKVVSGLRFNLISDIWMKIKRLFRITGNVIDEYELNREDKITRTDNSTIVDIKDELVNEDVIAITYYTDAPSVKEKKELYILDDRLYNVKSIVISALDEYNYENVLSYTVLDFVDMNIKMEEAYKLELYWYEDTSIIENILEEEIVEVNYSSVTFSSLIGYVINEPEDNNNEELMENNEEFFISEDTLLSIIENNSIDEKDYDVTEEYSDIIKVLYIEDIEEDYDKTDDIEIVDTEVYRENEEDYNETNDMSIINEEISEETEDTEFKELINNNKSEKEMLYDKNNLVDFIPYDLDNDGYVDYIEWSIPHLSNQSYQLIIRISQASHLDKDKKELQDVYLELYELDGITYEIPKDEYLKVTFELNLYKNRDITIYADTDNINTTVEVYEENTGELMFVFYNISNYEQNQLLFEDAPDNWTGKTFLLKSIDGSVIYDYIVDPTGTSGHVNSGSVECSVMYCSGNQKGYSKHGHDINVGTFSSYCSGTAVGNSMNGNCGGTVLGTILADSRFVADHHSSYCGVTIKAATGFVTGDYFCHGYGSGGNAKFYNHNHALDGSWDGDISATCCGFCGSYKAGGWTGSYTTACCGDDSGENVKTRVSSNTMDNNFVSSSSDDACCSSSSCVLNGQCYSGNTIDADSDGDTDYCVSSTWYDCNPSATSSIILSQCGYNSYCDANRNCINAAPCGGDGTIGNPYLLCNCEQLIASGYNDLGEYYKFNNNIDCSAHEQNILYNFSGEIDGGGYLLTLSGNKSIIGDGNYIKIKNLNISGDIYTFALNGVNINISNINFYNLTFHWKLLSEKIFFENISLYDSNFSGNISVGLLRDFMNNTGINTYYDYDSVLFNGIKMMNRYFLFGDQFNYWTLNNKNYIKITDYYTKEGERYLINDYEDWRNLLFFTSSFTHDIKINNDINGINFSIPYLSGNLYGNKKKLSNINIDFPEKDYLGLINDMNGNIYDLYSSGSVNGGSYVGGIVGNIGSGSITDSYFEGNINGSGSYIGGLFGNTVSFDIINSYSKGNISGSGSYVGGIAGYRGGSSTSIIDSYFEGNVNGSGSYVGGIAGSSFSSSIIDSYSKGNVNGSGSYVGGIAGEGGGGITGSYFEGNVNGSDSYVGGIAGYWSGSISNSYFEGVIIGIGSDIGGISGYGPHSASGWNSVSNTYVRANISGGSNVGGIGGRIYGSIYDSYFKGNIVCTGTCGGVLGRDRVGGRVNNVFSAGTITYGKMGVVGYRAGSLVEPLLCSYPTELLNSFWSISGATSCSEIGCGSGHLTECTQVSEDRFYDYTLEPIKSWDFTNYWSSNNSGVDAPVLKLKSECSSHSECVGQNKDFCNIYGTQDENAKRKPSVYGLFNSEDSVVELAIKNSCAPAKYMNRGTAAVSWDLGDLNYAYSRTQTYSSDPDWWQFAGDGMVTAKTNYTIDDDDLCFIYNYDPCSLSTISNVALRNAEGTRYNLGNITQGLPIASGCSSNWIWINLSPYLGSSNGYMSTVLFSGSSDYVREWRFGWLKNAKGEFLSSTNNYWCCGSPTDCVFNATSQGNRVSGNPISTSSGCYGQYSTINTGGGEGADLEYCGIDQITGESVWIAADSSEEACLGVGGFWNIGGNIAQTTCCEDDVGEFKKHFIVDNTLSHLFSNETDIACCDNSASCVKNNICYQSGTALVDIDGNEDLDYCNGGVWQDCYTKDHCNLSDGYRCYSGKCERLVFPPSGKRLEIKNKLNQNVAFVDDKGDMFLKGKVYTNIGTLNPPANSFIVQNGAGVNVAYFDINGNLYIKGDIVEAQTGLSGTGKKLEFKNSANTLVAFIDEYGNMKLRGGYIENYLF